MIIYLEPAPSDCPGDDNTVVIVDHIGQAKCQIDQRDYHICMLRSITCKARDTSLPDQCTCHHIKVDR